MKNKTLHKLNFEKLLIYPAEFQPQNYYDEPIDCKGFCVECETNGTLAPLDGRLTLMSHGCETSDFEKLLGSRTQRHDTVNYPVMFLLQDPGRDDDDLGEEQTFRGVTKRPPVNSYYFSPPHTLKSWPQTIEDVIQNNNYYGAYFAYLMEKHSLSNVYLTNLVKCKRVLVEKKKYRLVEESCVSHFLKHELEELSPKLIFCFGGVVYSSMRDRFPNYFPNCLRLYHPSFIENFAQTKNISKPDALIENDRRIAAALATLILEVQLDELAKKLNLKRVGYLNDFGCKDSWFGFINKELEAHNLTISCAFDSDNFQDCAFGFKYLKEPQNIHNPQIIEGFSKEFTSAEKSVEWWPAWAYFEPTYKNWDAETFVATRAGEFIKNLEGKLEIMLKMLKPISPEQSGQLK